MNEKVKVMVYAKLSLQAIPTEIQDADYTKILETIEEYIETNCQHVKVDDLIDIDPDRSKSITYCEVCYKTFP